MSTEILDYLDQLLDEPFTQLILAEDLLVQVGIIEDQALDSEKEMAFRDQLVGRKNG